MSIATKIPQRCVVGITLAILTFTGCARTPQQQSARFISRGKTYLANKDYARATLEFRNAVKADPNEAEAYYQLALTSLAADDPRSAALALRRATELNPKHAAAQTKLAELMTTARSKDILEEAQKRLQEVLKGSPDSIEALDTLAVAEARLGEPELAEKHLDEALQKSPQNLKTSAGLAGLKLSQGDTKGSEEVLKNAVLVAPQSAEARIVLAELYRTVNRPAEAEEQFRAASKLDPKNGIALLGISALEERAGHPEQAEETLRQLSALPDEQYKPLHALYLYQHDKKDAAIAELEKLASQNPKDRAARTRLIAAYMQAARTSDAERTITKALVSNPKDGDALVQRSEIFLRVGKYSEAQNDLIQLLRQRPESGEVHYLLARVDQVRGAGLQVNQELGEAVRLNPKLLAARIELAQRLLSQKSAQSALNLMNEAPAAQQKTAPFLAQRNWALWALGDRATLRKDIDAGLAVSHLPDLLLQDALLKLEQQNFSAAQASLREGLKLAPDDLRFMDALARSYAAQKQPSKGLEVLRQNASERPQSAPAQSLLGRWLLQSGDRAGARKAFEAAKAANPSDANPDLALAQLDIFEGKLDAARQKLTHLLVWNKDNLWAQASGLSAHVLLGNLEEMAGNHGKAIEHYRNVVDLDPTNAMALNNLAYLLADYANQPDEAIKFAQQAKEIDPKSADVADTIGWAFYHKGMYEMAIHHLAATAPTSSPRVRYHLAMAYLKAGNSERGREVFQEALRLDPKLPEAKMAKDVLNETLTAGK